MTNGWAPLAGVVTLLLLLAGALPKHESHVSSTAQTLVDPVTAIYDNFNSEEASLELVQVVFRHGARTPLNAVYNFRGVNWTHCRDHYEGVEVELHDENGGAQAPPILDPPVLPTNPACGPPPGPAGAARGCRQGTLTEAGYQMALDVGTWLRSRYVVGSSPTGGFLPDLGPDLATEAVAASMSPDVARAGAGGGSGAAGAGSVLRSLKAGSGAKPRIAAGAQASSPAVAALRTTPIRRTIATLRGVLTGLWPRLAGPAPRAVLPVGASVESLEIMYGSNNTCARLGPLYAAMQRDLDAADARDADLPRQTRLVAEALGLDPEQPILWPKLYDHLAAMIADGAPLPPGATREVLDVVWAQAERHEAGVLAPSADLCAALGPGGAESSSARARRCHEVLRLGIGMLVRRLVDNLDAHVEATAEAEAEPAAEPAAAAAAAPRLHLFSGHDSSVMPLLAVLGQPARAWPPFASHLVFELWRAAAPKGAKAEAAAAGGGGDGAEAAAAAGRHGLRAAAGSSRPEGPEFWVRVLYNGAPLVVPSLSNTAGWAPLGLLRQRALLPYAIGPSEHTSVCSRVDISDLLADRRAHRVATSRRALRHATL